MNPAVLRRKNKTSLKYMSARGYQLGVSSCEQVTEKELVRRERERNYKDFKVSLGKVLDLCGYEVKAMGNTFPMVRCCINFS